jgi:hypothetical protein
MLVLHGLNLSEEQIARELEIDPDDAQVMTSQLREGIVDRKPEVQLGGEVEYDEVYVVAGHQGHPAAVRKNGDSGRRRLKGAPGRGTLAKEKRSIFGMIQRVGWSLSACWRTSNRSKRSAEPSLARMVTSIPEPLVSSPRVRPARSASDRSGDR